MEIKYRKNWNQMKNHDYFRMILILFTKRKKKRKNCVESIFYINNRLLPMDSILLSFLLYYSVIMIEGFYTGFLWSLRYSFVIENWKLGCTSVACVVNIITLIHIISCYVKHSLCFFNFIEWNMPLHFIINIDLYSSRKY